MTRCHVTSRRRANSGGRTSPTHSSSGRPTHSFWGTDSHPTHSPSASCCDVHFCVVFLTVFVCSFRSHNADKMVRTNVTAIFQCNACGQLRLHRSGRIRDWHCLGVLFFRFPRSSRGLPLVRSFVAMLTRWMCTNQRDGIFY